MVSIPLLAASSLMVSGVADTNRLHQKPNRPISFPGFSQTIKKTELTLLQEKIKMEAFNPLQSISDLRENAQSTLHQFLKKCMTTTLSNNADSILNDKFKEFPEFSKPYLKDRIMRGLSHFCEMYSTSVPPSKESAFTQNLAQDFSKIWSSDRIHEMNIPPIFRSCLEVALSDIMLQGVNAYARLEFRLNREDKKLRQESDPDQIRRNKIIKDLRWGSMKHTCGLACATMNDHVVDWMLDEYVRKVHDLYPLLRIVSEYPNLN